MDKEETRTLDKFFIFSLCVIHEKATFLPAVNLGVQAPKVLGFLILVSHVNNCADQTISCRDVKLVQLVVLPLRFSGKQDGPNFPELWVYRHRAYVSFATIDQF